MTYDDRIGIKITTLRESLNLTPEELAERSGCDVLVIEQLEAGDLAPSLAPLIKITRALGCRLGTLLDDETEIGPVLTRKDEADSVTRFKGGSTDGQGQLAFYSLAAAKASKHMEPFLIEIQAAGSGDRAMSSHEGEEFIYALEGTVEVEYGKDTYTLEHGDSIYYDSIVPHEVRAGAGAGAVRQGHVHPRAWRQHLLRLDRAPRSASRGRRGSQDPRGRVHAVLIRPVDRRHGI
jgi:transcriptional regulator with XRE-family HTH domain